MSVSLAQICPFCYETHPPEGSKTCSAVREEVPADSPLARYVGTLFNLEDEGEQTDDPLACPDCGSHMVRVGVDYYRCTKPTCGETWEAR